MADGRDEVRNKQRTSTKYAAKQLAQQRIAEQRALQQRADRRRNLLIVGSSTLAILLVIGVIVLVGVNSHSKSAKPSTPASSQVVAAISSVPASAFNAVDLTSSGYSAPSKVITGQPPLTSGGKPEVLYMGAEYCPYCAAERWPLTVALSRFGSFKNLQETSSAAAPEVYPSTPTLSFHGATYSSPYITFSSVELETNQRQGNSYAPLETPTAAQEALIDSLDVSSSGEKGGIPFIDFGNQVVQVDGANYSPQLLAGLTHEQVAADLSKPTTKPGAAILGTANAMSSYICDIDGGKPASVCTSSGVTSAKAILAAVASTATTKK